MGQAIKYSQRQEIQRLRDSGKSLHAIVEATGVGITAVQRLCSRLKNEGEEGLKPRYSNCGKSKPDRQNWGYRSSLWLRRCHPHWGAPLIRLKLSQKYPDRKIPSVRAIQYWFKWSQMGQCQDKHPKEERAWAENPHDIWQTDAKEQGKLPDKLTGKPFCWLTITDEKSGGLIEAPVFPPKSDLSSQSSGFTKPFTSNFHKMGLTQSDEIR